MLISEVLSFFYSFYHVGLRCVNLFIQIYDDDDVNEGSHSFTCHPYV